MAYRCERLHIRMSAAELEQLDRFAARSQSSRSDAVRALIAAAAGGASVLADPDDIDDLDAVPPLEAVLEPFAAALDYPLDFDPIA